MEQALGGNLQAMLMTFIQHGEAGSKLSLHKNNEGFSVQITGAVHRSDIEERDLRSAFR